MGTVGTVTTFVHKKYGTHTYRDVYVNWARIF